MTRLVFIAVLVVGVFVVLRSRELALLTLRRSAPDEPAEAGTSGETGAPPKGGSRELLVVMLGIGLAVLGMAGLLYLSGGT